MVTRPRACEPRSQPRSNPCRRLLPRVLWGLLLASACRAQGRNETSASSAVPPPSGNGAVAEPEIEVATLELQNPSAFTREASPLYLSYYDLGLEPSALQGRSLQLRASDETLSVQSIDHDGDGAKDGLFALVDLAAAATRSFRVTSSAGPAPASPPPQAAA